MILGLWRAFLSRDRMAAAANTGSELDDFDDRNLDRAQPDLNALAVNLDCIYREAVRC
jgi:hypothetical protein